MRSPGSYLSSSSEDDSCGGQDIDEADFEVHEVNFGRASAERKRRELERRRLIKEMAGMEEYRNLQAGFKNSRYDGSHVNYQGVFHGDEYGGRNSSFDGMDMGMMARNSPRVGMAGGGDSSTYESGYRTPKSVGFRTPPLSPEEIGTTDLASKSVKVIGLVNDNFLSHPFLVLGRQCQVNAHSKRYHLMPFTLIGPTFHICQRQGFSVLWKGLGSTLLVRGMTLGVEDIVCKVTNWPKEINRHSKKRQIFQHILLKSISFAAITPFYAASLVETVQSEVASEATGFFDVFREGFWRLFTPPSTGRLVPIYVLVLPTVAHGLLSYLIFKGIKSLSLSAIKRVRESKGSHLRDGCLSHHAEMTASLIGNIVSGCILYPLECVLHRLHIQGTRTIIDSLDTGTEVTPILISYSGVFDCIRTTVDEEGVCGLYKGFGALLLQFGLQIALVRTVKLILEKNPFSQSPAPAFAGSSLENYPPVIADAGRTTPYAMPSYRSESSFSQNLYSDNRTMPRPFPRPGSSHELSFSTSNSRPRSRFSTHSPPSSYRFNGED